MISQVIGSIGSRQIGPLANWAPSDFCGKLGPGRLGPGKSGPGKLGPWKMLVRRIGPLENWDPNIKNTIIRIN